jgi:uridine kinase
VNGAAPSARRLLAVDGVDGSGKSVLADELMEALREAGVTPVLFRVDDFRRPIDWLQAGRVEADVYYEDYYDLALLDRCLTEFVAGAAAVELPVFDSKLERHVGRRSVPLRDATLAVVEGVFALRVPAVATSAAVIYLRTSFAEAERRILARDTARGRTVADVSHRITARYFPAQERYARACDPLGRADAIVDHERLGAPVVVRVDDARLGADVAAALARAVGAFAPPGGVG